MNCGLAFLLGALVATAFVVAVVVGILLYLKHRKKSLAEQLAGGAREVFDVAGKVLDAADKEVRKHDVCAKCGGAVPAGAKSCGSCGASLS